MEYSSFSIDEQPYTSLFKIYDHEFLSVSISKGLIDIYNLSIAGDGMPVTTSARCLLYTSQVLESDSFKIFGKVIGKCKGAEIPGFH